jgi:hypothetical protein
MQNLSPVPGDKNRLRFRDRPEGEVVDVELFYTKGSSPRTHREIREVLVTADDHERAAEAAVIAAAPEAHALGGRSGPHP